MNKTKRFLFNGSVMTLTSLLLRMISVFFNSYISKYLGSEGMGIYTLVNSVFGFAVTFATSGIALGTTRVVSESLAKEKGKEVRLALKKCIIYALLFSVTAFIFLFSFSGVIGEKILSDTRTVRSLRILAVSLPFIALSSVFNGYFNAVRRAYKNAAVMITEQMVTITATSILLSFAGFKGVEYSCFSVSIGTLISEIISLSLSLTMYLIDLRKNISKSGEYDKKIGKKLLGITLPLAFSAYARSGLLTLEHILIPIGLRKYGESYSSSLSLYGMIHGMVFPVIMFPSCLVYAFSGLLIPELASLKEKGMYGRINEIVTKVLRLTLIFAIGTAGIMTCFSYEISIAFYSNSEAFEYIRLFAPLITVMYLDGAVDSMLKGLNEQLYSMKVNIADSTLGVLTALFLIPKAGIKGYIVSVFICEVFNCSLSLFKLVSICTPGISLFKSILRPVTYIIISTLSVTFLFDKAGITLLTSDINLIIRIVVTLIVYLLLNFKKDIKRKLKNPI